MFDSHFKKIYLLTVLSAMCLTASAIGKTVYVEDIAIVPKPQSVIMADGTFSVKAGKVSKSVKYKTDKSLPEEAYSIVIANKGITVFSSSPSGKFYAKQSIRQMIPADIDTEADILVLPCCTIKDAPAFGYRGAHLDVARHFFSVEEVKEYLDIMALHKLNTFHFHLTEDQGWRIEIKSYPRLTEVGAWRKGTMIEKNFSSNDGVRYGGFYTQKEIKDIVRYAAERFITVIPEIEIPGHSVSVLASYPELGCRGKDYRYEVSTTWGVMPQVCCPGREETFTFWEKVLSEVIELFPSKYVHIGGDECPKDEWRICPLCQKRIKDEGLKNEEELQGYVTRRVEAFLNSKGRSIIGWDEILEGGVTPTATIMSWRGSKGAIQAAKMGNRAILTPNGFCYLDYYQTKDTENEPLAIGGNLPLSKCYSLDPFEELDEEQQKNIIGVQCNLWTEYISTLNYAEYMLLPRLAAIAEVAWTNGRKNMDDFMFRLRHLRTYYDQEGWNYRKQSF
ncbi:MAG: beta-N-acetylhexosaminidase [Bacteroidaceae bacterium]|nr:beta-N-acetylhexosaminidase [Bacteroidaceae bacterium]